MLHFLQGVTGREREACLVIVSFALGYHSLESCISGAGRTAWHGMVIRFLMVMVYIPLSHFTPPFGV